MANIVTFPLKLKRSNPVSRKRVFYLGYRYVGPMLCQEVQKLYLKRNGLHNGSRRWSMITYAKYDDYSQRKYCIELDQCDENSVPDMLDNFDLDKKVTFDELVAMGWTGSVHQSAKIIRLFHRSYDGIIFPDFARPLKETSFSMSVMMQANNIRNILPGRGLYAYTHYHHFCGHSGWVWMNLVQQGDPELKFVPVRIVKRLSEEFQANHYKNPKG